MTRKKVKIAWIPGNTTRRTSFRKRKAGLMKKMDELNILCDIDSFLIVYSPEQQEPMVWPSAAVVEELMERFMSVSDWDRCRKMTNHESYMRERIAKSQELLAKHRRGNGVMQALLSMNQLWWAGKRLEDLNSGELAELVWVVEEKRREITMRRELSQYGEVSSSPAPALDLLVPPPSCPELKAYPPRLGFSGEEDKSCAPSISPLENLAKETCLLPISSSAMEGLLPPSSGVETGMGLIGGHDSITWDQWISSMMNETTVTEDAARSERNVMGGERGFQQVYPSLSCVNPCTTLLAKDIGIAPGAAPNMRLAGEEIGIIDGTDSSLISQNGSHIGGVDGLHNMEVKLPHGGAGGILVESSPGNKGSCAFVLQDGHTGGGDEVQFYHQVASGSPMIMTQFNNMEVGRGSSIGPIKDPAGLNSDWLFFA